MRNRKTPGRLQVQRRGQLPARGRVLVLSRMRYRRVLACTAVNSGRLRTSSQVTVVPAKTSPRNGHKRRLMQIETNTGDDLS